MDFKISTKIKFHTNSVPIKGYTLTHIHQGIVLG